VLRAVQREARPATAAEQDVLGRWSGWGAVPEVFDDRREEFRWARDQLAILLSPAELAAARRNTLNAHYTDAALVEAMWTAVQALGFDRGRVLEPGCGSGNVIAFAPGGAQVTGIELDPVTAGIAALLHPAAEIRAESFADSRDADGSYDLAIGNVPFGNMVLHDRRHNPAGHSIHNHFIVKALRLVRPGGLVAVLTSRFTMDARNPAARREISALADLAGAIRLPGGAHQRAAGTGVITDLLVLRRREPGRQPDPAAWEKTRHAGLDGAQVPVNEYFLDHPDAVLGQMGAVHGVYGTDDLVVRPSGDTIAAFTAALTRLADSARARGLAYQPAGQVADTHRPVAAAAPLAAQSDGYLRALPDGTFTKVAGGAEQPHPVPAGQAAELRHLLGLRDTARALLEAEAASAEDTPGIGELRAELGHRYDHYLVTFGPLNRFLLRGTGRTDPATGEPVMTRIRPRQGGFTADPFAPLVYALEEFDPVGQRATKAVIFRERVIAPRTPRLGADTPADALAICLDLRGEVRLAEIARLLGTTQDHARAQLGTLVFDDPGTGRLVPAAEYLSGNVREKLRHAGHAAEEDPAFTVNVAELRRVIPPDLTPGEIDARLGAAWIDAACVQQFLREILDDPRLQVEHPGGQIWAVRGNLGTVLARSTWGTSRYPAPELAQALLEQRSIDVHDTVTDASGQHRSVLNVDATVAAQEKAAELAGRFADWAWEDPARAAGLARTYNDRFNSLVLRSYDDATLSLPGLALTFRPRAHQVAAVARMIAEPAVLLAHEVGAGKTAEMIIGVTELRRLGLISKAAIVVPNHMLEQFAREWLQLYPQAKVMTAGQEDLQRDRRHGFVARCATGSWDGIVMSRSAFERIPLSPAHQQAYLDRELDQMRQWIASAKNVGGITVKKLEKALLRAEQRLKAKLDSAKDPGITFESTGIDYLCIDEAHGYKNLRTPSNISDAAIDGSMRASDLDMKIDYLRRRNGARVVTFATATPIANSVTEAYVMQRYLRPDLLAAAGIEVFDTWAATFGQVVSQVEMAPEGGSSFRMKSRFARFANVPEMLRMFHVAADVKTAEDLALPVPDLRQRADGQRAPETVTVEPSEQLLAYVRDLGERAAKVRNRAVGPEEDNMLKISGDGRRAALDLRLAGLPQAAPGKITAAADRIAAIWAAHDDDEYFDPGGIPYPVRGSLQLVFSDLGTPGPGWNAYEELRDQLVARGLPPEAIRFIHQARTDRDKAQLFAACRAGRIAVLVGSTEKMGVGTNVQDRAIALHHLDAPWRPADVAQREGRILRQGNLNRNLGREIEIIRYVTERSFDGYMWQTLERKARFIGQAMHGRLDTREITDIGDTALSFSEVKAIATGNPLLMDKAEADAALARLQRAERAHRRNQEALRHAISDFDAEISRLTVLAGAVDSAIARRHDTRGEKFAMTVGQVHYSKRADAGEHVKDILGREISGLAGQLRRAVTIGHLGGFTVTAEVRRSLGATDVSVGLEGAPGTTIELPASGVRGADPAGLITRLEHRLAQLETRKTTALAGIEHARRQITHARSSIGQPFPHAAELATARERVRDIDGALDRMARQDPGRTATPEPEPDGSTGRGRQLQSGTQAARPETDAARKAYPSDGHHVAAQRGNDPRPAADLDDGRRTEANRAAVAASQAYRAGELETARQLTDQAAALDPSRAGLWAEHRQQITARQLILDARAAHAEGDHQRAHKLQSDARHLDPRMPALWDGGLPARPADRQAPQSGEHEGPVPGPRQAAVTHRPAAQTAGRPASPAAGDTTQPDQQTPRPSWPSPPARSRQQQPVPGPGADAEQLQAQPPGDAALGEHAAHQRTAAGDPAASTGHAASDPSAGWPARGPRNAREPASPGPQAKHEADASHQAAGRQESGTAAEAEPGGNQSPRRPAVPGADWRDHVLGQGRQPWQSGATWPRDPALRRPPEAAAPDTGIEPGR
jgi:N12 class adenine-specific DNA methylase/SAM-dependent methyltransferase